MLLIFLAGGENMDTYVLFILSGLIMLLLKGIINRGLKFLKLSCGNNKPLFIPGEDFQAVISLAPLIVD